MQLMIYYVVLTLLANAIVVFICLGIEKLLPTFSMPIFLIMFFISLWAAWIAAVRLTEPKAEPASADGAAGDQRV